MTNAQILSVYRASHNLPADTPLWTWQGWVEQGYKPRKGEAPRHHVKLLVKKGNRTVYREQSLFELSQCDKIV